jgi:hypothetical protein
MRGEGKARLGLQIVYSIMIGMKTGDFPNRTAAGLFASVLLHF